MATKRATKLHLLTVREVQTAGDGDHSDGGGLHASSAWRFSDLGAALHRADWCRRREMGLGAARRSNSAQAGTGLAAARDRRRRQAVTASLKRHKGHAIRWITVFCLVGLVASTHAGTQADRGPHRGGDGRRHHHAAGRRQPPAQDPAGRDRRTREGATVRAGIEAAPGRVAGSTGKPWPSAARPTDTGARSAASWSAALMLA